MHLSGDQQFLYACGRTWKGRGEGQKSTLRISQFINNNYNYYYIVGRHMFIKIVI